MPLYFAYGSNMALSQMRERCPGAAPVGVGFLPDHALAFTRLSQKRACGVADVIPQPAAEVWGVLYEVDPLELERLDRSEGCNGPGRVNAYDRTEVTVLQAGHPTRPVRAQLYFVQEKSPRPLLPSAAYKALLVQGATEHGLPEWYCTQLQQLEVM